MLSIVVLVSLFPLYWSFVGASRDNAAISKVPPTLIPGGNLLHNLTTAFTDFDMKLALFNSLTVSTIVTISVVLTSTMAGFAFAKLRFKGRGALLIVVVATMMVPTQLGIIPLYIMMANWFHLAGSVWSLILPAATSAFGVFFMRQYLVTALPTELLDAGRVDGCSTLQLYWHQVLPVARPAMAVLGMLTFLATWNDFFWPIIALTSQEPTVQVALRQLGGGYVHDQSVIMAGTLLGTVPVLVVFGLLGRQIVGGIMQGAVKG